MRSADKNFGSLQRRFAKLATEALLPAAILLMNVGGSPAHASGVVFDFNATEVGLQALKNNTGAPAASDDNSQTGTVTYPTTIQAYMDKVLRGTGGNPDWSVTITGADLRGRPPIPAAASAIPATITSCIAAPRPHVRTERLAPPRQISAPFIKRPSSRRAASLRYFRIRRPTMHSIISTTEKISRCSSPAAITSMLRSKSRA